VKRALALPVLALPAFACIGARRPEARPGFVRMVDTDSDKAVSVVESRAFETHQSALVDPRSVAAALESSGMFGSDDAVALSGPVADELAIMEPHEHLRIVGWASDAPRVYMVYLRRKRLHIAFYSRGQQLETHDAVLPEPAVAIAALTPSPSATPSQSPSPSEVASPEPTSSPSPEPTLSEAPSPSPTAIARKPPRRRRTRPPPPITETEARKKINDLDVLLGRGLITVAEHKTKRKEILARL